MAQTMTRYLALSGMGFRFLVGDTKFQWLRALFLLAASGICGVKTLKLYRLGIRFIRAVADRMWEENNDDDQIGDNEFDRPRMVERER